MCALKCKYFLCCSSLVRREISKCSAPACTSLRTQALYSAAGSSFALYSAILMSFAHIAAFWRCFAQTLHVFAWLWCTIALGPEGSAGGHGARSEHTVWVHRPVAVSACHALGTAQKLSLHSLRLREQRFVGVARASAAATRRLSFVARCDQCVRACYCLLGQCARCGESRCARVLCSVAPFASSTARGCFLLLKVAQGCALIELSVCAVL